MAGASQIVAIDKFENRLALAKKIGATICLNSLTKNVWKELKNIFTTNGLDVFIDNTGNTEIISEGFKNVIKYRKTYIGWSSSTYEISKINTLPLHFGKSITGSHGGDLARTTIFRDT